MSKGRKVPPKQQPKIERRLPIVSIPVAYGDQQGIRLAETLHYQIEGEANNPKPVIQVTKEKVERISSAEGLQLFGLGFDRSSERIASTWPQEWHYLDISSLDALDSLGFHVKNPQTFLITDLGIREFGKFVYKETDVSNFFDAWIDLFVFEYIIQVEIEKYKQLQLQGFISDKDSNLPESFNLQVMDAWVILENCAIRIDAMWERLIRHVLLIYFTGKTGANMKKNDWTRVDQVIRSKTNAVQLRFYSMLYQANQDYHLSIINPMKKLRNRIIHQFAQRPIEAVPVGIAEIDLPTTIYEMWNLVNKEHSRVRECLLIMAAIIKAKTPENTRLHAP